ncbi:SOS response-associated peptidase [Rufibacter sediminis]|uniref:Abasic site processing protein n=1 Tax=Rufibacter sediminis TaxID=2762756 RepID=A0ABR6VW43_9BACT|nr:SOS response-associated peptidase [Rufibacter sediminis]MBC3541400.1 SOS response-associated peptidase [Rufibacter sediminis]
MCGRYSVVKKVSNGHRLALKDTSVTNDPAYNAAPSQRLPVITNEHPEKVQLYQWGLIPFWAKDLKSLRNKPINARAETLAEKQSFKKLLQSKRCLVLADGFYEWQMSDSHKTPYRILLKSEELFTFAGLWDEWVDKSTGEIKHTYTIITTEANELVKPIHERMPVILSPEAEEVWLNNHQKQFEYIDLLKPYDPGLMKAYPVSPLVNSPINNVPEVLNSL